MQPIDLDMRGRTLLWAAPWGGSWRLSFMRKSAGVVGTLQNLKFQAPNYKQISNSNTQWPKQVWNLEFRFRLWRIICLLFVICDLEFLFLHYSTTACNLYRHSQEFTFCLEYKERMWARQVTTFCECAFLRRLEIRRRTTRDCVCLNLSKSWQSA